jgi:LysM repeat protein
MKIFYNGLWIAMIFVLCGNFSLAQKMHGYRSGTLFYYFHKIMKDETLSQIAKSYNLSVNEILEVNSTIADPEKIVEGQLIKIPNYSHFIDRYPHDQWNFILYRVRHGDKLKTIAKEFGTEVDDIKNVNPDIENKPVMGSEIRVPVKRPNAVVAQKTNTDDRNRGRQDKDRNEQDKQPVRNPALTFNWGNDHSTSEETSSGNINCAEYVYKTGTTFKISIIAPLKTTDGSIVQSGASFLCGALLAINKMKNTGLTIKLNSFNLENRSSIDRILQSPELMESNIIIAQASTDELNKLAAFANERRIYLIVTDETKSRSLVENNPFVIQLYPSEDAVFRKLMSKQYNESVFPILIKPEKPDSLMLEKYRTVLKKRFTSFREQKHKMGMRDLEYKNLLEVNHLNLIFVCPTADPAKDEAFVSDLISRLNIVKNPLSVFGNSNWQGFGIIEKSLYFNTNVHFVQSASVDYSDKETKLFVQQYRKAYNSEPGKYAFLGHDATYYFLAALRKYGTEFQNCISEFDMTLLQSRYKLVRNNINDGFINEGCFLLEYTRDNIEIERK